MMDEEIPCCFEEALLDGEEGMSRSNNNNLLSPESLSATFRVFLEHNKIPLEAYNITKLSRFIRVNPRSNIEIGELENQLKHKLEPVDWLTGFYRLPHHVQIAGCEAYKTGQIYGMDASSGAAVVALDPRPGDHVLDLCCAPGAKMCMIADMLGDKGSVTGVDVAEARLGACRNVLAKYQIYNSRLFLQDGTAFSCLAPAQNDQTEARDEPLREKGEENGTQQGEIGRAKRHTRKRECSELIASRWRKKAKRRQKGKDELSNIFYANPHELALISSSSQLYDKVNIDAQCTLDASVRHILQFKKVGWTTFTPEISNTTMQLQKQLIVNGFRLLAPGGFLVYSTCSFCREQNEDVVLWLLEQEPQARVVPIESASKMPCSEGLVPHTLRFYPKDTGTSGLFIAKITKLPTK